MAKRVKFDSDKKFTAKKFAESIKYIMMSAKRHKLTFFISIFFVIIEAVYFSITPLLIQNLTKAVSGTQTTFFGLEMIWQYWMYILIGCIILLICLEFTINYFSNLFAKQTEIFLRTYALEKLVKHDMTYYFDNQIGKIISRIISDTAGVGEGFNNFFIGAIFSVTNLISTTVLLLSLDVVVGGASIGLFFVLLIGLWISFVIYRRWIIKSIDYKQNADADITDRLMNIRLVKSNGTEEYESKRSIEVNKEYGNKLMKSVQWFGVLQIFSGAFASMIPVFVLIVFVISNNGDISSNAQYATMVALISASYNLVGALSYLPQTFRGLTKMSNCVMRLGYIINPIPLIDRNIEKNTWFKSIESIEFDKVTFSYPNAPNKVVIPEFSYKFEKGKSYALVGESGIGKSTIARMVLRFYDPTSGNILINGNKLTDLNLSQYLEHVGYVEQDPQILYGTVFENIQYPLFEKTKEEIIEASKKAKLHEFVMTLPEGYDTILGERGFLLSGGQKQRLVIARLFLKNPSLLVLDEATSALDNIVESQIQSELNELMKSRTTLVIAHRLSTIKEVDEIIVLQKNKGVVQVGTFDVLKSQRGIFQDLYKAGLVN